MMHHEVTVELDEFMANLFGEFIYYENYYLCFNFGYQIETVLLTFYNLIYFQDCYKTMIQSLFDWSNWDTIFDSETDYWGLLDYCEDSEDEDVTVYDYNPIESDEEKFWLGDGTYNGDCFPGNLEFWSFYERYKSNFTYP